MVVGVNAVAATGTNEINTPYETVDRLVKLDMRAVPAPVIIQPPPTEIVRRKAVPIVASTVAIIPMWVHLRGTRVGLELPPQLGVGPLGKVPSLNKNTPTQYTH